MIRTRSKSSLFFMLCMLSVLLIGMQSALFYVHYSMGSLMYSLATSPLATALYSPLRLLAWLPVLQFIAWQLCAYLVLILWAWFCAYETGRLCRLPAGGIYAYGVFLWAIACSLLFALNQHYYPSSFFANFPVNLQLLLSIVGGASLIALLNFIIAPVHKKTGMLLLTTIALIVAAEIYHPATVSFPVTTTQPNIIIVGIDSLRPDYIGDATPNLKNFLANAVNFTNAYTPLARTYPAWISLLTGKYPKHHAARMNLQLQSRVLQNEFIGEHLKAAGYYNIYGTDEPRFSDINAAYGFDTIIGPKSGAVEFLISAISDFPMANILSNLAIGRYFFPYNYANRAIDVNYQPDNFLQLIKTGLQNKPNNQPLFLAMHFCLAHWPFTWAHDAQQADSMLPARYAASVAAVDKQFGDFMQLLEQTHLLQNSLIFVVSDHGVTLGKAHDRLIDKTTYAGKQERLRFITAFKTSDDNGFTINTSYGQGTDVLSLKQYQMVLAMQHNTLPSRTVNSLASIIDIAPTILDFLQLKPMPSDGVSLLGAEQKPRAFYMETADTIADIESDKIFLSNVVKHAINMYEFDDKSGNLFINPIADALIVANKQRAVMLDDWILAQYPPETKYTLQAAAGDQFKVKSTLMPAYYILANVKSGEWSIGTDTPLSRHAPLLALHNAFKHFYGDEIS